MTAAINIENASLRFRVYYNPTPGIKEAVVRYFSRQPRSQGMKEFSVLKDINISLKGGDRLGIIGLNGAGKSTLLKMLVGIYPPLSGRIHVQGKITPLIELGTGFDYELSGRENIYLNGSLLGRSYKQMKQLEQQVIDFSELSESIDLPIKYYSSGMLGRLAFSIGSVVDPEILILDEIFAAGDAHFVHKATDRLHQLLNTSQIVILVSHTLKQIQDLCNQAIVLHKGIIAARGTPKEMIDFYMREIVHLEAAS